METKLHEINITISRESKEEIFNAFLNRKKTCLMLEKDELTGNDTLLVPRKSLKWDIETFPESFKGFNGRFMLDEKTFSEMYNNGFKLVTSLNYEGFRNFRVCTPPTVAEELEEARKNNETLWLVLDYSILTKSTNYPVLKNMVKLMENL